MANFEQALQAYLQGKNPQGNNELMGPGNYPQAGLQELLIRARQEAIAGQRQLSTQGTPSPVPLSNKISYQQYPRGQAPKSTVAGQHFIGAQALSPEEQKIRQAQLPSGYRSTLWQDNQHVFDGGRNYVSQDEQDYQALRKRMLSQPLPGGEGYQQKQQPSGNFGNDIGAMMQQMPNEIKQQIMQIIQQWMSSNRQR